MSIESTADLEGLREAGRVTCDTLDALVAHIDAGVTTGDLDAVAAAVLARNGARSAPAIVYGFPGTVLISVNDEIVHGIPGRRRLQPGDLVSLDVTIEKDGYVADAARSVIVGEAPEVPNIYDRSQDDVLTEGLVLTIEPMISAGSSYPVQCADGWTLRTRDGSLAAHSEHTLIITRGEPLILAA
jgi:methionyl aminopeptidase